MGVIDQAGADLAVGVKTDTKKVVIVLKTTSRQLRAALLALNTGHAPLALDTCTSDPSLLQRR